MAAVKAARLGDEYGAPQKMHVIGDMSKDILFVLDTNSLPESLNEAARRLAAQDGHWLKTVGRSDCGSSFVAPSTGRRPKRCQTSPTRMWLNYRSLIHSTTPRPRSGSRLR
jgi:hypothetical protein